MIVIALICALADVNLAARRDRCTSRASAITDLVQSRALTLLALDGCEASRHVRP